MRTNSGLALALELETFLDDRSVAADVAVLALCWLLADLVLLAEAGKGASRKAAYLAIVEQLVCCVEQLSAEKTKVM